MNSTFISNAKFNVSAFSNNALARCVAYVRCAMLTFNKKGYFVGLQRQSGAIFACFISCYSNIMA